MKTQNFDLPFLTINVINKIQKRFNPANIIFLATSKEIRVATLNYKISLIHIGIFLFRFFNQLCVSLFKVRICGLTDK